MAADPQVVEAAGKVATVAAWTIFKILVPVAIVIFILEWLGLSLRKKLINWWNNRRSNSVEKCTRCGGNLVEKNGKFGPFMGCSNYPKCEFTKNI
jgi:hypothetical protein